MFAISTIVMLMVPSVSGEVIATDAWGNQLYSADDPSASYSGYDLSALPADEVILGLDGADPDETVFWGPCVNAQFYGWGMCQNGISTNGFIYVGDWTGKPSNFTPECGQNDSGQNVIQLFHDDIQVREIYVSTFGAGGLSDDPMPIAHPDGADYWSSQMFVVQYKDASYPGSSDTWDMTLYMWNSGDMVFEYGPGMPTKHAAAVGIITYDGSYSLNIACAEQAIPVVKRPAPGPATSTCDLPNDSQHRVRFRGGVRDYCSLSDPIGMTGPHRVAAITADRGCRVIADVDPGPGRSMRPVRVGATLSEDTDVWAACGGRGGSVTLELEDLSVPAMEPLSESAYFIRAFHPCRSADVRDVEPRC